jgi:hypothetical protein
MTRALHPATAAEIRSEVCGLALLAEFEFDSGVQRVFSGSGGPLIWSGPDGPVRFLPAGSLVSVSATRAGTDGRVTGHELTIAFAALSEAGFTQEDIEQVTEGLMSGGWQGQTIRLFAAAFDTGNRILGDPVLIAEERLDSQSDRLGGDLAAITVRTAVLGADRDIPVQRVYSPDDQRAEFPGDTGMDRQPLVGVEPVRIGVAPAAPSAVTPSAALSTFLRG